MSTSSPPHWDMTNIFPSLDSAEYKAAIDDVKEQIAALEAFFEQEISSTDAETPVARLAELVGEGIERFNALYELSGRFAHIFPALFR